MAVLEANRVADSGGATLTVPPGTLIFHCANSAPSGFLKANGASLSTATYAALFTAIGYTFGGSGGSFSVPDLRGEFPRGWDDGRGIDSGRVFGTAQSDAIRNIAGGMKISGGSGGFDGFFGACTQTGSNGNFYSPLSTTSGSGGLSFTASAVVPTAAENRPRNIALLACIKF